ncbi:MAG: hypothetical protein NUV81_03510 [bacterium]|nr:hypothetical protein [bacterium]
MSTHLLLRTVGELMVAFAALRVHHRVLHERKIDRAVFHTMRIEQIIGVLGAICIFLAFIVEIQ